MNRKQAESFLRNYYARTLGQPGSQFGSWQDIEDWLKGLPDAQVTAEANRLLFTLPVPEQDKLAGKDAAAAWRRSQAQQAGGLAPSPLATRAQQRPSLQVTAPAAALGRPTPQQAPTTPLTTPAPPAPSYVRDYPPLDTGPQAGKARIPRPQNIQSYDDVAAYRDEVYDYISDWMDANPDAMPDERTQIWNEAGWLIEQANQDYKNRQGLAGAGGPQWRPGELALQQAQLAESQRQFDVSQQLQREQERRLLQDMLAQSQLATAQMVQSARGQTLGALTELAPNMLPAGTAYTPGFEPGGLATRMGASPLPSVQLQLPNLVNPALQSQQQVMTPLLQFLQSRR